MRKNLIVLLSIVNFLVCSQGMCVHDKFIQNITFHYYDDLTEVNQAKQGRLLQTANSSSSTSTMGNLRIFADYTNLKTGGQTEQNMIKRMMNISANYFYNVLKVQRLPKLQYPSDSPNTCSILTVPSNYITVGTVGDLGILVTNQVNTVQYVAKSTSCALLKSNNRPIWGVIIWNNNFLQLDQTGFQKNVYVGIHEIVHILGYSAALYEKFPKGNPYRSQNNVQYLTSDIIVNEMKNHFGCNNPLGIILEDQDGTLIPSHNERKVFGNQFMTASGKKASYFSRTTLALLASTGWYNVSYDYAEPTVWGKQKGCNFLNIDDCTSNQFCSNSDFGCDWDQIAIGKCNVDIFTGSCKLMTYFTNTICIDENYELKNLNSQLEANERGGFNSRCHFSNFRKAGLAANDLNNRCYVTICSLSKSFLYILVGNSILVCSQSTAGKDIPGPAELDGTLRCPTSFNNYCDNKKTCTYSCNKNGVCINGQCLCTGSTTLSSTCLDTALTINQVDSTGGLTKAIIDRGDILILINTKPNKGYFSVNVIQTIEREVVKGINSGNLFFSKKNTINSVSTYGTFRDQFGQIVLCQKIFGCTECTQSGCLSCPRGQSKIRGKCQRPSRL